MTTRMLVTLHIFLKDGLELITSCLMMTSMSVTLSIFLKAVSLYILSYVQQLVRDIAQSSERQSHHILSYYVQQLVSNIAHFPESQFITILYHDQQLVSEIALHEVSLHIVPMTNSWSVTLHIFLKGSLITSCLMTNRK